MPDDVQPLGPTVVTSRLESAAASSVDVPRWMPLLLLIVCGVTFGLIFSMNRVATQGGIPFSAYVFWQTLGGAGALFVVLLITRGPLPKVSLAYLRTYFVVGFFTLAFPFVLLAFIAPKLPAGVISLGGTLSPTLTYIFAMSLKMDRFRWVRITGILVGLGGVLLVLLPATSLPEGGMAGWAVLSFFVPVSYAAGTICAARFPPPGGEPIALGVGLLGASTVMLLPVMAGFGDWWFFSGPMDDADWALILAMLINAQFFYLIFEIVRLSGPVFFSTQNYVATLAGIGWGIGILGESHSVWIWAALVLLFIGLFLVTRTSGSRRETAWAPRGVSRRDTVLPSAIHVRSHRHRMLGPDRRGADSPEA